MSKHSSAWTRRDFVKAVGAGVVVPLAAYDAPGRTVPSTSPVRAWGPVVDDRKLKIGLIGCGGRGTGSAIQALRADKNTVLWAMGDVLPDRLAGSLRGITEEMGAESGARVEVPEERRFLGFDSYQKVIGSGVDVVLLTTYPAFRPLHLRAAVEAGKHCFAEKPVAVDAPGVRSVLESTAIAKKKNLGLVVGFCWRYNDGMRGMYEQVNGGALGEITSVYTNYLTGTLAKRPRQPEWSDLEFQLRNWWHFTWISGDHIVEQAVHSIDRLMWATGDRLPLRVVCLGGRAARNGPEHGHAYDHFSAIYEYEGGMRTFHSCRQIDGCPSDNTDYIYGSKGSAVVNGWVPTYSVRDAAGKETWKYTGRTDRDMYQTEHDEFFASIRAGTPINDGERGANSTMMAVMARMAAYTGQTISWERAMNSKEDLVPASLAFGDMPVPPVAVPGVTKFV
ncbi:MAG: Gfo/Idh/MocA family oxidoreductase [Phycisphaerales bacterium]|nr:Gfo/Idh/MocA family oxidoreductase [Phycisphaerales bacterium]